MNGGAKRKHRAVMPMSALEGVAIYALWNTRRFSTAEIAQVVKRSESEIANLIGKISDAARAPTLTLLTGGKA